MKFDRKAMIIMLISAFIMLFLVLCILLIVVGCQARKNAKEESEPVIANVRGYLYHGFEVNAFRECNGTEEYWVTGDVGINIWSLYNELASEQYMPVYVEMKAQFMNFEEGEAQGDYVGKILVKELYHLAYETKGCELVKDYNYYLHGNEPFWSLIIDENRGVFMQEAGEEEIYATYRTPKEIDNGLEYKLVSGSRPLTIKIRKLDTYDSMSGAYYGYSAFVGFKDKVYYGQALVGKPVF